MSSALLVSVMFLFWQHVSFFRTAGQATRANTRTNSTPVQTTVSSQREEKRIPRTNPQHKQNLQKQTP